MEMKETEMQNASVPQETSAVSQDEAVVTAQTPAVEGAEINVADGAQSAVANDMAPAQAAASMPAASAPVVTVQKPKMTFAKFRNKYLNQKVFNLVLFMLGLAMVVLSAFEFAHLALQFTDIYGEMIDAIVGLNYMSYFQILITLLALGAYFIQIIFSIIALIKKGHKVRIDHIATPLAIAVLWQFFEKYNADSFFCRTMNLGLFYEIILWVLLVYIVIRLFKNDWSKRLGAVICSLVGVALVIGLYLLMEDGFFLSLDFSTLSKDMEWKALGQAFLDLTLGEQLTLLTGVLCGVFSALLPFMGLSMVAYYADVLAGDESRQYYSLRYAQRTSIVMVVMESINIALSLLCYFLCGSKSNVICTLDYKMLVLSLLIPIALIVMSWLPWKIHSTIYARNCKKHDQLRGAK